MELKAMDMPQNSGLLLAYEKRMNRSVLDKYFFKSFNQIGFDDLLQFGGKNSNLGELMRISKKNHFKVPYGFALSVKVFRHFLSFNKIESRLYDALERDRTGKECRTIILQCKLPTETENELRLKIRKSLRLNGEFKYAVRSSATSEDLPSASFAGLHDSYLNLKNEDEIITHIIRCYASLFNERAISYRDQRKIDHRLVNISVSIQQMVQSEHGVSGVMFTVDPESGFENVIVIESFSGLGESLVQGKVNPDQFILYKPILNKGTCSIIEKKIGNRLLNVHSSNESLGSKLKHFESNIAFSLNDQELVKLGIWGNAIENHFSELYGKKTHMDIEWAKDGQSGEIFLLQARPETVHTPKRSIQSFWNHYHLRKKGKILCTGTSVGSSISAGKAKIIHSPKDLHLLKPGDILVTDKTDPDWEPIMKIASAIVTNRGGRTCHAAIIAREFGIPAVIGCSSATIEIINDQMITVDSAEGDLGYVYEGELPFEIESIPDIDLSGLKTKVMMNMANPDQAFKCVHLPNQGVGLVRIEFIIGNTIGIHPRAAAEYDHLDDHLTKMDIFRKSAGYLSPSEFFIQQLRMNTAKIAVAFYPKPILVRFSDFKTNEYRKLLGGSTFEPIEENPMIGFRGSLRYYDPDYRSGFSLECKAMRLIREEMGLDNLNLMIPFCRTIEEADLVLKELETNGISRSKGYKIWMMCEIPSNALQAEDFLKKFDGFSIGSNDLTQLTLGIDRESAKTNPIFIENNPSVLKLINLAVQAGKKLKKPIGICGQGPSDDPDFLEELIRLGIDSISLNPDSILKSIPMIKQAEKKIYEQKKERPFKSSRFEFSHQKSQPPT